MANDTVHSACGEGNGCKGSLDDWFCVCDAPGWKVVDGNPRICHESKYKDFFTFSAFSVFRFFSIF